MPAVHVFQKTPNGDPDTTAPTIKLGWSKMHGRSGSREYQPGSVQLATVAKDGAVLEPTPEGNGWFVDLDRDGLNNLIRFLRKVRDEAYGADA